MPYNYLIEEDIRNSFKVDFKNSIIIFDEATSNLDRISEKAIMETIKLLAASKTIIMIAHRLSTVQDCDNIFLFSEGKIEDSGTYEQLFKSSTKFVDLS